MMAFSRIMYIFMTITSKSLKPVVMNKQTLQPVIIPDKFYTSATFFILCVINSFGSMTGICVLIIYSRFHSTGAAMPPVHMLRWRWYRIQANSFVYRIDRSEYCVMFNSGIIIELILLKFMVSTKSHLHSNVK